MEVTAKLGERAKCVRAIGWGRQPKNKQESGEPINGIRFGNQFFAFVAFAFVSDQERKRDTARV